MNINRRFFFKRLFSASVVFGIFGKSAANELKLNDENNFITSDSFKDVKVYIGDRSGDITKQHYISAKKLGNKKSIIKMPFIFDKNGYCPALNGVRSIDIPKIISLKIYDLNDNLKFSSSKFNVTDKFLSNLLDPTIKNNSEALLNAPYIITGRANIRNPRWNAPVSDLPDPEASVANSEAINLMLSSGNKYVELDDSVRYISNTLIPQDSITIVGAGRSVSSLIWCGGDRPIISRGNYQESNAKGISNIRLIDLKIQDNAPYRNQHYSIDLSNGNSCGLERCWLDGNSGSSPGDKYGVLLGTSKSCKDPNMKSFVAHFRDSRLSKATLVMNTTDYYISGCELWGDDRLNAVELGGGGTIADGTQIVPGCNSGIFLFNNFGYDIDTLKIIGVYFDGSTNKHLFTGWGILSDKGVGLVSAEIIGCDFWHLNKGGVYLNRFYSSTLQSNFRDCDSDDTGESDIIIDDIFSSYIYNRHFRSVAPKSNLTKRVSIASPYVLNGKKGYPISSVGGQVAFSSSYSKSVCINTECFEFLGGSARTVDHYANFPSPYEFEGKVINVAGMPYFSDGNVFSSLSNDAHIVKDLNFNLNEMTHSGNYIIQKPNRAINPVWVSDLNFPIYLKVINADNTIVIQKIQSLSDGKELIRYRSNNQWNK
ncbi:pyocin knob domain-containing protein [Klebsiella quasipneumoniae]